MTRCNYVEARLRALVDGELAQDEQRKVLSHLDGCACCRGAYARTHSMVAMLQDQEPDEVPAHFSAGLQVRLARHRRERAGSRQRFAWVDALRSRLHVRPMWGVLGGVGTVAAVAAVCVLFLSRGIGAEEVARRAELSWQRIRNYGCTFESRGVYRGQVRTFTQKQFFRKNGPNGEFRLDTGQDYPLTTFVYADRVVHYVPGGEWRGKGPLVITWPRKEGKSALPFPFGITWQSGGNISLDQIIRQLNENQDAELMGEDAVGGIECYRLRFTAVPPGGSERDRYELWVDKESFLPRRVSWYRDRDNHIITEAKSLEVNYKTLPTGTFDFQMPEGAFYVDGDLDPHVLALPFLENERENFDADPIEAASAETWKRTRSVAFPLLTPSWLPDGFQLVRVRRKVGYWVDVYWMRVPQQGPAQILKLVEQDGRTDPPADVRDGRPVNLGTADGPLPGLLVQGKEPYPHLYVTWRQGRTRYTLFASGIGLADVKRMARSMTTVSAPAPRIAATARTSSVEFNGEPSAVPSETEETPASPAPAPSGDTPIAADQPPMMPDMADTEPAGAGAR